MKHFKDHSSGYLYDPWEFIQGKRRRLLEDSWAEVVRTELLDELPVEKIAGGFHEAMGRPSKELHTMLGVLTLQQMLDLTDRETTDALAFDVRWHYALDITGESDAGKYVCERTLRNYRTKMIDLRLDEVLFAVVTDRLLKAFGVDTSKQRIDSTHICSNMKNLGRVRLFARTIKGFLRDLQKERAECLDRVDKELAGRYLKEEELGCFSQTKPSQAKRSLKVLSEDLLALVRLFEGDKEVAAMESYALLQRLLSEQCEVSQAGEDNGEGDGSKVEVKPPKEVSSDSLQNPSDPDATYDGHKGQGYQVQITETFQPTPEGEDEEKGSRPVVPDLIVSVEVEGAHQSDGDALMGSIEDTQGRGCGPKELSADSAYGSDENVEEAKKKGVEVIAPTLGTTSKEKLTLEDFELDEETGEVKSCPEGFIPVETKRTKTGNHVASFDLDTCQGCPKRDCCAVGFEKGAARLRYTEKQSRLARRRVHERTEEFQDKYRWRAGVEATMSRYKSQTGAGRLRVRGLPAVRFAEVMKAIGLNIFRCAKALRDRKQAENEDSSASSTIAAAIVGLLSQITAVLRTSGSFRQCGSYLCRDRATRPTQVEA